MMFRCLLPHRPMLMCLLVAAIAFVPLQAAADTQVPQSVAALLPTELQLRDQNWGVIKGAEEFEGITFDGTIYADFPDAVSCDFTIGPFFELHMKGQTAWEASPEQMNMFVEMFVPKFEVHAKDLPDDVKWRIGEQNTLREFAMGETHDEQLPNGHIVYIDFTWKCAKNPGGENVILRGFARRGTTILTFDFWANGGTAEARAMALGILDRFEKLDIQALLK